MFYRLVIDNEEGTNQIYGFAKSTSSLLLHGITNTISYNKGLLRRNNWDLGKPCTCVWINFFRTNDKST